ncbi:hypothetical protein HPT25_19420 [Bacillus sp. BRMEA1]|uniref:hypothetical protein n=1 Tax=Neobacillus endophyticus TaxID=2738405 RepID=UPI001564DE36|nr:hypothetical protein [Neobacillus endophyticus]NRD79534.1 hypothetical protein [Neobacillus endophyticus]
MNRRLADIQKRVKKEHKDITKYIKHVFEALDKKAEDHRKLAALNALAGIKIKGEEEKTFYETINETKKLLLDVLEKTIADFDHQGDKHWDKHYKDGVKE